MRLIFGQVNEPMNNTLRQSNAEILFRSDDL